MDFNQNGQDRQQNSDNRDGWENARENWDKWEEQQKKKDWDKWDSDASHSSYYNQPTHTPYDQGFAVASVVCGLLSITFSCCPLSLSLGAMGILFACLCSRSSRPLYGNSRMGLYLSIFGCFYGTVNLIYLAVRNAAFIKQIFSGGSL